MILTLTWPPSSLMEAQTLQFFSTTNKTQQKEQNGVIVKMLLPNNNNNNNNSSTGNSTSTNTNTTTHSATYCDFNNDPCPTQFNGICESETKADLCGGGDCYDCDPCHQFHMDCTSCVAGGCWWCPGDAFCSSQVLEDPVWQRIEFLFKTKIMPSCVTENDWISSSHKSDTCTTGYDNGDDSSSDKNRNVFNDPLYDAMTWSYDLIHVAPVWKRNILGQGIRIRMNDNGIDNQHPEFVNHFDIAGSCNDRYRPINLTTDVHGTAVASLVAGAANNGVCAVGIAPEAILSSCVHNLQATSPGDLAATIVAKLQHMDISINAWGIQTCRPTVQINVRRQLQQRQSLSSPLPITTTSEQECIFRNDHPWSPCHICNFFMKDNDDDNDSEDLELSCQVQIIKYCALRYSYDPTACSEYLDLFVKCEYNALIPEEQAALTNGIQNGRDGKGIVYLFASGNSYGTGTDTNFDGWTNSRYTITVGAVGKDGQHASYSTPGAALFVVGPGGDIDHLTNNFVAVPGGTHCGDISVGTSFAVPFVSGVVALMLQVNPNLTWRDVQAILANTSSHDTSSSSSDKDGLETWTINAAGYYHSYKYGFGLVNAEAAVNASEIWSLLGPERQILVESGPVNVSLTDDPTNLASSFAVVNASAGRNFVTESVVVYLDLIHASRGDLRIVLTSPQGTESMLHPSKRPENSHLQEEERWKLMTVRAWGESPVGTWTLSLVDESAGIVSPCADIPFQYVWDQNDDSFDGAITTCATLESAGACAEGGVLYGLVTQLRVGNITAVNACCACGGGMPASSVNILRSWKMVVYGHIDTSTEQPATGTLSIQVEDPETSLEGMTGEDTSAVFVAESSSSSSASSLTVAAIITFLTAPWISITAGIFLLQIPAQRSSILT